MTPASKQSTARAGTARALLWGAAALGAYLAATAVSFQAGLLPARPLYDGIAPLTPYRWVNPPPELAAENQPPARGADTVYLGPHGSDALTVATEDGQAIVIFNAGAFLDRETETQVRVGITPLDPEAVAPPPPDLRFDGNAYRIDATYLESGDPAVPQIPITVLLRYPLHAEVLLRWDGETWEQILGTQLVAQLQVYADAPGLGVFVAAAPPREEGAGGFPWLLAAGAAGAAAAAVAGVILGRRGGKVPAGRGGRRPGRSGGGSRATGGGYQSRAGTPPRRTRRS